MRQRIHIFPLIITQAQKHTLGSSLKLREIERERESLSETIGKDVDRQADEDLPWPLYSRTTRLVLLILKSR